MRTNVKQAAIKGVLTAIALLGVVAFAANPKDKMKVTFTHPVHVQGDTLQPGKYTIETMSGKSANNNVMEVYGPNNVHFKTSFTTIDAKKNGGAEKTHVSILKVGDERYLDKLFIASRVYGYQVLLPEDVQSKASTGESEDLSASLE